MLSLVPENMYLSLDEGRVKGKSGIFTLVAVVTGVGGGSVHRLEIGAIFIWIILHSSEPIQMGRITFFSPLFCSPLPTFAALVPISLIRSQWFTFSGPVILFQPYTFVK